jgi:hypothetical protein
MLASSRVKTAEIEDLLNVITSRPGFTPSIFDRFSHLASRLGDQPSLVGLLLGSLYVPSDDVDTELVLPSHVYTWGAVDTTAPGTAAESIQTGILTATSIMNGQNVATPDLSNSSAVYVTINTTSPAYGKVNLVTVNAQADWKGSVNGVLGGSEPQAFQWASAVAGRLSVTGTVWLTVLVQDPISKQWSQSPGNASVHQVFQVANQRAVDSPGSMAFSGSFKNGNDLSLQFYAEPGKSYSIGVVADVDIASNFTGTQQGSRVPPVPAGVNFGWSGFLKVGVPFMMIRNAILAK